MGVNILINSWATFRVPGHEVGKGEWWVLALGALLGEWGRGSKGVSSTDFSTFLTEKGLRFGLNLNFPKPFIIYELASICACSEQELALPPFWAGQLLPRISLPSVACAASAPYPQVSGIFIPVLYCLSLSNCSSLSYLETQQQQHLKSPLYLPSLSSSFLNSLLSSQNPRSCLRNSLGSSSLGETDGGSASYCKFSENVL